MARGVGRRRPGVVARSLALVVATIGLVVLPPQAAQAATVAWTGGGDGLTWSDPANWSSGGVPAAGDTVDIAGTGLTIQLDVAAAQTADITLRTDGDLTIQNDGAATSTLAPASMFVRGRLLLDVPLRRVPDVGPVELPVTLGPAAALDLPRSITDRSVTLVSDDPASPGSAIVRGSQANDAHFDVLNAQLTLKKTPGTAAAVSVVVGRPATSPGATDGMSGRLVWAASNQLFPGLAGDMIGNHGPGTLVVGGGATADVGAFTDRVWLLSLDGGTVATSTALSAELAVDGGLTFQDAGQVGNAITGNLRLIRKGAITHVPPPFPVDASAMGGAPQAIAATLRGTDPIAVAAGSDLRLEKACGYTGSMEVTAGTVTAVEGYGGVVTENGGTYVDGSQGTCVPPDPPAVPGPPRAFDLIARKGSVELMWGPPEDTGSHPILSYRLWWSAGGSEFQSIDVEPSALPFTHQALTDHAIHDYYVEAVSEAGTGPPTRTLTAVPGPPPGAFERVSLANGDVELPAGSRQPRILDSGDGVAFTSDAAAVPGGDLDEVADVYFRDRQTRTTEQVSVSENGEDANGPSYDPDASEVGRGRYVAFASEATNLVGDAGADGLSNIFVRDRRGERTDLVTLPVASAELPEGLTGSRLPTMSGDGRWIAFESDDPRLVDADANGVADVFLHDRETGVTQRVSLSPKGDELNLSSSDPALSRDGGTVAFVTTDQAAVDGWQFGSFHGIVAVQDGLNELVSVPSEGTVLNGNAWAPSVSADGRFVAFVSDGALVEEDTDTLADLYVRDRFEQVTLLLTPGSDSTVSGEPAISADGTWVTHVLHNGESAETWATSVASGESRLVHQGGVSSTSVDGTGRHVAFATNEYVVDGDTNLAEDVFVRDMDRDPFGPPVGAPRELEARGGAGAVRLSWLPPADTSPADIEYYRIFRSGEAGQLGVALGNTLEPVYLDESLENGMTYHYTVVAAVAAGEGTPSEQVSATAREGQGLSVAIGTEGDAAPGVPVTLEVHGVNLTPAAMDGPTAVTVLLPEHGPAFQEASGAGWTCDDKTLAGQVIVKCTRDAGLAALEATPPVRLTLLPGPDSARTTYLVGYSLSTMTMSVVSHSPYELQVGEPKRAHLEVVTEAPASLTPEEAPAEDGTPGDTQDVTVLVRNRGAGSTFGPLTVTVPIPDGVVVKGTEADGFWTCGAPVGSEITCTGDGQLAPRAAAPEIRLQAVGAESPPGTAVNLQPVAESRDALGAVRGDGLAAIGLPAATPPVLELEVPAPVETELPAPVTAATSGRIAAALAGTSVVKKAMTFQPVIANIGGDAPAAKVVYQQTVAEGMKVDLVGGATDWDCVQNTTKLACTSKTDIAIAGGASVAGPQLAVSTVAVGGTSGGWVSSANAFQDASIFSSSASIAMQKAIIVEGVDKIINVYGSSPAPAPIPAPPPDPVSRPTTEVRFEHSPLYGKQKSSFTLSLLGDPNTGPAAPRTFAVLVPPGLAIGAAGIVVNATGYPEGVAAPTCTTRVEEFPTGSGAAIICPQAAEIPAGSRVDVTVPVTADEHIAGTIETTSGFLTVRTDGDSVPASAEEGAADLAAGGAITLSEAVVTKLNGIEFVADAGAPQRLDAATVADDGTVTPTRVVLDATRTIDIGRPVTYGWVQTAGDPVTFEAPRPEDLPGAGTLPTYPAGTVFKTGDATVAQPHAFGRQVAFTAPLVDEREELAFTLYVTDGAAVPTAVTTVAIDPLPDNPPQVTSVELYDVTAAAELDPGTAPPAGHQVRITYDVTDPDGDPVVVVPAVVRPSELATLPITPAGDHTFTFHWPSNVSRMAIQARLTDGQVAETTGRAVTAPHIMTIGPEPAPLGIAIAQPDKGVAPDSTVGLTADLTNPVDGADTTTVQWSALSGPVTVTPAPDGRTATLVVPPTAKAGDTIVVEAVAKRGTGSTASLATSKVTLAVVEPPALTLGSIRLAGEGGQPPTLLLTESVTQMTADVTGGVAPYSFAWSLPSGGGALTDAAGAVVTFTAPAKPGLTPLKVVVTDARGKTVTQTLALIVGTIPSGTLGSNACDVGGSLKTIYDAAAGLAPGDRVAVTYGGLHIDLGPKSTLLGSATGCNAAMSLNISGGAATWGDVGLTNVTGTVTGTQISITSATISLPATWRINAVTLENVRFSFATYAFTGSLVTNVLPVVDANPVVTQAQTRLTFGADRITLTAQAKLRQADVTLAGVYCRADVPCTEPPAGVPGPVPAGALAVHASVTALPLFGRTITGQGDLTVADGDVSGSIDFTWSGGDPAGGSVAITSAALRWNDKGLKFRADASLGGRFAATLEGDYVDEDNWSANVSGGLKDDWQVAAGLQLGKYDAATGTGTGIKGTIASKAGDLTYAVQLDVNGSWTTGPLTVKQLRITLANGSAAPASCLAPEHRDGTFLQVVGLAEVSWGTKPVELQVTACVLPGTGWTVVTGTGASGISIAPGLDLTGVTLTASHRVATSTTSIVLNATGAAYGVRGAATLAMVAPGSGSTEYLAEISVNLADLGVGLSGTGHLMYASKRINDLGEVPGLADKIGSGPTGPPPTGEPPPSCAGAVPTNPLAGLPLAAGFTALTRQQLPADLCGFLEHELQLPASPTVVVSITLEGTPTITAALSAGPEGVEVFTTDDGSSLRLRSVSLSISAGGSFGLAADATLAVPKPTATSATDVANLDLRASVSVQLLGVPSITVALSKTGDAWQDAFGVPGLSLGDLAIQGGVVFTAPVPTPSIGFGAQILDMPTSWKNTLGIIPTSTGGMEPVQLVLNISAANPILDIRLGTADGHDFMRPLKPVSSSLENALTIDYAQLVIAPFGGAVGPFQYSPGFNLGFRGKVIGVDVDVRAELDMGTGNMSAHMEVGAFQVGPVAMDRTTLDFELTPTSGVTFAFQGGVTVGSTRATGRLAVEAKLVGSAPSVKLDFEASVGNLALVPGALELDGLLLSIKADLGGPGGFSAQQVGLSVGAAASVTVLSVPLQVRGSVTLAPFVGISGGEFLVTTGAFSIGGVADIRGRGCDETRMKLIPAGLPKPPTNGPCVQASFGLDRPFSFAANGELDIAGIRASFDGTIDDTGIAIREAGVRLAGAAEAKIHDSRLYAGPGLTSAMKEKDANGNLVTVGNGDFVLRGYAAVKLGAFQTQIKVDAGNVASTRWVRGEATVDILKNSPVLSASVALKGDFKWVAGDGFRWSLDGTGTLKVLTLPVASTEFHLGHDGFRIKGVVNVGAVNATVTGDVKMTNGQLRFLFSGAVTVSVLDLRAAGTATLTNHNGGVELTAQVDVRVGAFHVKGFAAFSTAGDLCLGGTAAVQVPGAERFPQLASGTASFCSKAMNGYPAGINAEFRLLDLFYLSVKWENASRFAALAWVNAPGAQWHTEVCHWGACAGLKAGVAGHLFIGVASYETQISVPWQSNKIVVRPGVNIDARMTAYAKVCLLGQCAGPSVGIRLAYPPLTVCGRFGVLFWDIDVCVRNDPFRVTGRVV